MKKIMKTFVSLLLAFCLCVPVSAEAENFSADSTQLIDEPHVYALPESEEWETMSLESRRSACYVSREEAESMTTPALLETVLNYPFLVDLFAFNSFEYAVKVVSERFPALDVLLHRTDAKASIDNLTTASSASRTNTDYSFTQEAACTIIYSFSESCIAEQPHEMQTRETAVPYYTNTNVRTPNGSQVPVMQNITWTDFTNMMYQMTGVYYEYNASTAAAICDDYLESYPSAELLRASTPKYNCHSYAWYSTSSTNPYWMNDPSAYIEDESYTETDVARNVKVTYYDRTEDVPYVHSGIVSSVGAANSITVKSKWGAFGLFSHDIDDCPYSGIIDYWGQ